MDATFDWLLANDPEAKRMSRRAYGRRFGILTPEDESDIQAAEVPVGIDEDLARIATGFHCPACARKSLHAGCVE